MLMANILDSMSKKRSSGVGLSTSFLNEVPLDLIEKRRSARRGNYGGRMGIDSNSESMLESPRDDDMTTKAMIESLFPPSLVKNENSEDTTAQCKIFLNFPLISMFVKKRQNFMILF